MIILIGIKRMAENFDFCIAHYSSKRLGNVNFSRRLGQFATSWLGVASIRQLHKTKILAVAQSISTSLLERNRHTTTTSAMKTAGNKDNVLDQDRESEEEMKSVHAHYYITCICVVQDTVTTTSI